MADVKAHSEQKIKMGVLGGGAWGTALATHCARMGHDTLLWAREAEVVESVNTEHKNNIFLPGYDLPPSLKATGDIREAFEHAEIILMVIPTQFVEATLEQTKNLLTGDKVLVSCAKGIVINSLETVNHVMERVFPATTHDRLAYLSGPSFAAEVAKQLPTAVTVASRSAATADKVAKLLSTSRFKCYKSNDVVGVELGGALKNVLAIGCGISDGMQFGHNGRAALITRGVYEITRLAVEMGGNPLTLSGLSGIGDIILTCTGDLSRNRSVGLRIGKGESLQEITNSMTAVAEGVKTAEAAHNLAKKLGIECPVIAGIYRVLHGGEDAAKVVTEVMSREVKDEIDIKITQKMAA